MASGTGHDDEAGHDHHGHGHGHHGHGHHGPGGHVHAPKTFGRAFLIGIALNAGFVVAEVVAGLAGHSVALLADAGHNISDVLGLLVAWIATVLARRSPTTRFTYGLGGSSILAALFNALLLLVAVGALSLEAVQRLFDPAPVAGGTVIVVAVIGIAVNGISAALFAAGRHGDLNVRGAYLHMLSDAAVSAGVAVAGVMILLTGWLWLDPLASLLVNAVILASTWGLLRDSLAMSLQGVPPGVDMAAVRAQLAGAAGVTGLHDLHVWPMSTTEIALTCHLSMPAGHPGDAALHALAADLEERFGISHATLQVETGPGRACPQGAGHRGRAGSGDGPLRAAAGHA